VPNTYFHITTAYSILRHNGVDVGKFDYLGPMNFVDADGVQLRLTVSPSTMAARLPLPKHR